MSYSVDNTYQIILNRCLSNPLLSDKDKRQGSIIYDTIAPLCLELAEAYIRMDILENQTYLMTATGTNLDRKAYDFGVTREPATQAQMIAKFFTYEKNNDGQIIYYDDEDNVTTKELGGEPHKIEMEVPIGTRFILEVDTSLIYEYIEDREDREVDNETHKIVKCETYGTIGNNVGLLIPMTPINNLVEARIISTDTLGQNEEDDDTFRLRVRETILNQGFGGNIQDYVTKVNALDGVSQTKVFPIWDTGNGLNGGGSVLLSIVGEDSNTFIPADGEFIDTIQQRVDPTQDGRGVGIAPIGHIVTVTTPVNYYIDVKVTVHLNSNYSLAGGVENQIKDKIKEYFYQERKNFKQDYNLTIYRSQIISRVLSLEAVENVTSVLLGHYVEGETTIYEDKDYEDELVDVGTLNGQKLPLFHDIIPIEV